MALKPLIEELNVRRQLLGLTALMCERDTFKVGWSSYEYTEDNLARFERETANKEKVKAKTAMEAALHEARERAEAQAVAEKEAEEQRLIEAGAVAGFEAWCRRGGRTNAGDGWVIRPDGSLREHDSIECPRPRYKDEGTKKWNVVHPDEVALHWSKASSAATHQFETVFVPEGGLTAEQRRTVENILEELEEWWDGASGLASGKESPSVGDGWLFPATGKCLTPDFETSRQKHEEEERRQAEAEEQVKKAQEEAKRIADSPFAALAALKEQLK